MTVNRLRGEVEIALDGKRFVLRPTFEAMVEIETLAGVGMIALARRVARLDFGYRDVAAIVFAGLKAAGEPAKYDRVGEMVFKAGIARLTPAIQEFLELAITAGEPVEADAPGEARAADGDRT